MKVLFKLVLLALFFIFLGWLYIVYLYLHKDNKQSLENIKDDLQKEAKIVAKVVRKQKSEVEKLAKDVSETISDRQSEMEKFIKSMQKEAFEIKDIAERFKDVSERTLRRDMQKLEKSGLIKQVGSTRNSKYQIIS